MYVDSLSVVVPVYNSAASLRQLIERLDLFFKSAACNCELVLVNDGSEDNSWSIIQEFAQRFQWILGVDLTANFGQHNALLCGILLAGNDVIVTLDDDLQHPPEEIPKLLDALNDGTDVVYGLAIHSRHAAWRIAASRIMSLIAQLHAPGSGYHLSPFRAFRASLFQHPFDFDIGPVAIDILLAKRTERFVSIYVQHHARSIGASSYDFRRLLGLAFNHFQAFGLMPKRSIRRSNNLSQLPTETCLCHEYLSLVIAKTTDRRSDSSVRSCNHRPKRRLCQPCGE